MLVVDDDADIRLLLRHVLGAGGFEVEATGAARDVVRLAAGPPAAHVVVLDVQMPDVDGWEALELLRADTRTRRVPVVMCTVKAAPADALRAWELGCDAYVAKPFDIEALVRDVAELLELSDDQRQARRLDHQERLRALPL